jgi:hypothetical protein
MQLEDESPAPESGERYDRRRRHVLWYGSAVLVVLFIIVVLQVST